MDVSFADAADHKGTSTFRFRPLTRKIPRARLSQCDPVAIAAATDIKALSALFQDVALGDVASLGVFHACAAVGCLIAATTTVCTGVLASPVLVTAPPTETSRAASRKRLLPSAQF
jgi:hypothetical protein